VNGERVDAITSSQYKGYRIDVWHVPFDEQLHHSFLERLLAAGSALGVQDDLWQWSVSDGEQTLAGNKELSRIVAVEEARYWVDTL
jgi:hypothetical protein